jgi:hypothetical protein
MIQVVALLWALVFWSWIVFCIGMGVANNAAVEALTLPIFLTIAVFVFTLVAAFKLT